MTHGDRRTSLVVLVVGVVAFVGLAAWLVPWHPVPGGTPPPASPGSVFTARQISAAEDFSTWARVWSWSSLAVSLLVAGWLGFTRLGARLVERLPGRWWVQVVLTVAALVLVGRVVTLPFAVLMHRLLLDRGLTHQSWGGFASDLVRTELVTIVTTSVGLVVLLACARRWRRAWPAVAGGLLAVLVLAGSFVYPLVVEPLFNSFTPLPDGPLRSQILRLADREHVHVDDVLVADASRRTTTLNAYVSGFGSTRRVVVYDNLLKDLPDDQVLSVVAHELGHARHDDVVIGSLLGAAGALAGVGLLGLLVGPLGRRRAMGDPALVPLLLALLAIGTVLASPLENAVSRQIETRADVDALEATHDPQAFIAMQRQLSLTSLADPTPPAWSQFWFGSHPTTLTRIAIARQLGGS
ncbi:M48 family metallopeptidase [Nocardioides ungokensis]|uniref:M48 family metallopeptidase n=1 Tax=Nocardioides ungokensis TaxID=1643322 RepID=UPI001FEC5A23|nr:M48 family metallopeptidase [Nocardioides ungokensis]